MTIKAAKLIDLNIDYLAEQWLDATAGDHLLSAPRERIGDKDVEKIIYQVLQGIALCLDNKEQLYLFQSKGILYKKAKYLGEMRRAQGFEVEQVLTEYLTLRRELWKLLRDKLHSDDIDVFELEDRISFCLMNILKATIESFHHRQTKDLREQAVTDALTGLYNRRYFDKMIEQELYRAQRYKRELSLALIDIDHFKMFNDVCGHLCGDLALEEVSQIIRRFLRASDAAARYGGEEFALILPETSLEAANRVCNRIRRAIERNKFEYDNVAMDMTVSLGIACYPEDAQSVKDLVLQADKALYKAKKGGRNRVVCAASADTKTRWFKGISAT